MTRADLSPTLSAAEAALQDEMMSHEVWLQEAGCEVSDTDARSSLHTRVHDEQPLRGVEGACMAGGVQRHRAHHAWRA
jgi:hypothetical protein